jgi:hypothetical protein
MAPDIVNFHQIAHTVVDGAAEHVPALTACLLSAAVFGILWLGLYYLYRKKTFVRI